MDYSRLEKLSVLWAEQLHLEFEEICWQYNIHLQPPIIEIGTSKSNFGSWDARTRTLRISSFLISNYSWAVTQNVFKHEIGHQICSEIFHSRGTAHGDDFIKACKMLGLPEEYQNASCHMPEHILFLTKGTSYSVGGRKMISKVEKLLSLAQSANEHEANLAMQKAKEIIDRYNIASLASEETSKYHHVIINNRKKQMPFYQRRICTILIEFFFVKVVTASLYDPHTNNTYKTIELFGTPENVTLAEYCYSFLQNRLLFLWNQNRHKFSGKVRTEKSSFYMGVLDGFYDQLAKIGRADKLKIPTPYPGEGKGLHELMVFEDTCLDAYVQMRFPRLRKISRRGSKVYSSTYQVGVENGNSLTLSKGLTKADGNRGRFLG